MPNKLSARAVALGKGRCGNPHKPFHSCEIAIESIGEIPSAIKKMRSMTDIPDSDWGKVKEYLNYAVDRYPLVIISNEFSIVLGKRRDHICIKARNFAGDIHGGIDVKPF